MENYNYYKKLKQIHELRHIHDILFKIHQNLFPFNFLKISLSML
jgi:hypothetical protein